MIKFPNASNSQPHSLIVQRILKIHISYHVQVPLSLGIVIALHRIRLPCICLATRHDQRTFSEQNPLNKCSYFHCIVELLLRGILVKSFVHLISEILLGLWFIDFYSSTVWVHLDARLGLASGGFYGVLSVGGQELCRKLGPHSCGSSYVHTIVHSRKNKSIKIDV